MVAPPIRTNRLLLVEDTLSDARAVGACLRSSRPERYEIAEAETVLQALAHLEREEVDVIIAAGAQNFLCKSDMASHTFKRVLGYALGRVREGQLQALRGILQGCRALSSQQSGAPVIQALAGLAPIRDRSPAPFSELQDGYGDLLERYMEYLRVKTGKHRDLIDVHVVALGAALRKLRQSRIPAFASGGRQFALEMMGLLVKYYRLSFRLLFPERATQ